VIKLKIKYLGLILSILALIAFVQTISIAGPVITASINQKLKASSIELPSNRLSLVAFSSDGNTLASVESDGQIMLWDIVSGQVRGTLSNQSKYLVSGVVFSPDSNTLASVSNNSIQLWDVRSGDVRLTLPASALVTAPVFSPDGETLAAVSQDASVTLWNSQSGFTTQILTDHQSGVNAIAFSPNSKVLATGGRDAQIKLWNVATGTEQASIAGESGTVVTDLVFSPDGNTLAAVAQDASVTLWNSQSGSTTQILTDHQSGVDAIAFSPNSKVLATGGRDAQIKLWNVATGTEQASIAGESGTVVTDLVFSPDGNLLASIGESERVFLWDMTNKQSQLLTGHKDWVDKIVFSSNHKTLASVGKNGQVIVWDLLTGLEHLAFQVPLLGGAGGNSQVATFSNSSTNTSIPAGSVLTNGNGQAVNRIAVSKNIKNTKKKSNHDWKGITAFAISPDGTLYGGAARDGKVRLWTSSGKERFATSEHHGVAVTGVVFSADGKRLVSVGRDTEIQISDVANGKKIQTLTAHEHPIRTVAASSDGKLFASAGEETRIMLWDAQAGKLIKILSGHTDFVNAVSFSADGKYLASAGADGRALLWDVETGQLVQTLLGHSGEVNAVAFSPNGKFLASGSADSQVVLWDVSTGQQIQSLTGHQASVRAVAFSPNGKKLVSAGEGARILVWDTATRKLDKQIVGATDAINALVFNPFGNLIAGSENGEVKEWDVSKGQAKKIINVPIQPQSNNSDGIPSVSLIEPVGSVPASTGQIAQPVSTHLATDTLSNIFKQVLDWLIPSAEAALPDPNQGPGGPILVVTSTCPTCGGTFNKYYAEILRTEGLNEFAMADVGSVTESVLSGYDVVILAQMPLTSVQVTLFNNWVNAGGNLIAIRPDSQLASLLGITTAGSTLSDGYLLVDTSRTPGNGIVDQTIQFHGTADRYTLNGALSLATLYTNANTATTNPALTLRSIGANGGQAAAFTYDLAASIVYTRQGNPAWATQERDGFTPIRSDDKFFGNATGDSQPDWVDLNKIAIPQADEQQRLLVNLILEMNRDRKPLPRFWYFPRGKKAVVIMTGDDHGNGGTAGRFDQFIASSPAGCSVANWECVRGTSYIYSNTPLTNTQAAAYQNAGFEVGLHINTNCADFTPDSLETFYTQQISDWTAKYSSISAPMTQRHHCIAWSDWVTGAKVQFNHGIRLDTSYYFWPPSWVLNRPGFFSGSGMPMRFVNLDGSIIDVYHATSQMTDESGQTYPFTIDTLLDRALGAEGYYGAYTINAHTDVSQTSEATATLNSALNRSVPIVSSKQMLDWLDSRNSSSFGSLAWNNSSLSFTVTAGAGANGLQAMLPLNSAAGVLVNLAGPNGAVAYTVDTIKGIHYAFFAAAVGAYTATYAADTTSPVVTSTSPANGATGVIQLPMVTATFNEAVDPATVTTSNFQLQAGSNPPVLATVSYDAGTRSAKLTPNAALTGSTTYTATVLPGVKDLSGNPLVSSVTWSFTTEAQPCASVPCSAWGNSTAPKVPAVNDPGPVELGVKFIVDLSGTINGVRFYKGSTNTGTHVGHLWSSTGQLLASAQFQNETASGWQQVNFATPVAVTASTVYIASYYAPNGNYAATNSPEFGTSGVDAQRVHLLKSGVSGANGVFLYGAGGGFPTNSFSDTNYWVDVVFATGPDSTAPAVAAQSPVSGATGVGTNASVTATFNEEMDAATITTTTFELRNASNNLVTATVSYNGTNRTATLTPSALLASNATYTATLKGGAIEPRVKDLAGNALVANLTWSFTTGTGSVQSCASPTSIWPANPTPSVITEPDTSVELGVKFKSSVNGFICGVRFYKGNANTGTHVGKLWTSTGQLLASAQFQNETASGWQQVSFASPVAITASTTYIASYLAPAGGYSFNSNYFANSVTSGSLYAFNNAESGGNGVYLYGAGGFPANTFQSTNYWVDVLFSASPDTTAPTVTSTSPATGATGVIPATSVTATFSEAVDGATVNTTTLELRDPSNTIVPATVAYNSATNTATLTPTNSLTASTSYTAKVKGGANGVKDLASNALTSDVSWSFTTGVDPCSTGGNLIVCENSKTGNPSSEWDISGAGDTSIQGFATDISVNRGQSVRFKINTPSTNYRLDIYRMGYYAGNGARKIATVQPSAALPQNQPSCLNNTTTGLIDCGNWAEAASWAVPADATSGIYFAKVVREDGANTGASHIVFIVRDDTSTSDIVFQTSDTTWQAYNDYGGNSLYTGSPDGRAYKVSYNRPFNTRAVAGGEDWLFNAEYPMVRWLEANGYNVSYITGVDTDRFGNLLKNHKLFLSVGHDEYWSKQQRENVEKARDNTLVNQVNPVNLAFFSGNEVFWKTRWENNITNSNGSLGTDAYRTLVCYKETHANAKIDPLPGVWTGSWRDPRFSPPADGGRPENSLPGTIFMVNGAPGSTVSIQVPEADGKMRFWRNTSIANLTPGSTATLPFGTLGYEWDEDLDNGFRPDGLMRLSTTTVTGVPVLLDYGSSYGSGTAVHSLTMYRANSGALVFGAGTIQWSWGLDNNHDGTVTPSDSSMKQATINLFADMNVQPATLQPGLIAATASNDITAPVSTITSPANNSSVALGSNVVISGTATDAVGGKVGGVEVSVDGGATWHSATGRSTWTYSWTAPGTSTTVTIRSRAVDDNGNLEIPGTGATVNVGSGSDTTLPTAPSNLVATSISTTQINLAWGASSDNIGVTGYRVERCQGAGCSNFVQIAAPAATSFGDFGLIPGTTYQYRVRATDAASNLSAYSAVANATTQPDTTPPTVTVTSPLNGATGVSLGTAVTVTFSEALDAATINGSTLELRDTSNILVSAAVTYNASNKTATLTPTLPLLPGVTYTATVKGGATDPRVKDVVGNALSASVTWSFTTVSILGFLSPSANGAVIASAGDNNGFETTPANAYANDGQFAVDTNSGTGTGTTCTGTSKDKHVFYNYGANLPAGVTIKGIQVRLDAKADSTTGAPKMCVQLSWDGGTTWTATKTTATLTTTEVTYLLGSNADTWGHTWNTTGTSELSDTKFRVRVINVASNTNRDFSLDWVAVQVAYQ
jgi:WD40 repeat protein